MSTSAVPSATRGAVAGVVLAGGRSRRMGGRDKALLDLAGVTLIERVVERLAPQVSALAVSANGETDRFSHLGLSVLRDTLNGFQGPLAGILAAMQWARRSSKSLVVTVPADTPFIPRGLVAALFNARDEKEVVVAGSRGVDHPTVALWSVTTADDLAAWLRDDAHRAVRDWIATRRAVTLAFPDDEGRDPFFNINTPADLEAALPRASGAKR